MKDETIKSLGYDQINKTYWAKCPDEPGRHHRFLRVGEMQEAGDEYCDLSAQHWIAIVDLKRVEEGNCLRRRRLPCPNPSTCPECPKVV